MIKVNGEDMPCLRCGKRLEWFEEFGLADGAVDEDAIVLSFENDESDEQEEELDEEGSITSEKEVHSYEPELSQNRIQRHLSERSTILTTRVQMSLVRMNIVKKRNSMLMK